MEIEPSKEVTGGICNQESFDLELVELISNRVVDYLKSQGNTAPLRELVKYVKQLGLVPTSFKDEDIE